ncbi:hypothetical protein [Maricaulis salignorans]|nr:hypothetical protein [Maricaulis salignorans]
MMISNPIASNGNAQLAFNHIRDWREAGCLADPRLSPDTVSILKALTLPLWEKADYRLLSDLLESENAIGILRHTPAVSPNLVRLLHRLPGPFRIPRVIRFIRNEDEATIISRISMGCIDRSRSLISKLQTSQSRSDFWDKASSHFLDRCIPFPEAPKIIDPRVTPIRTVDSLRSCGLKLHLCLRNFIGEALSGEQSFYVFNGEKQIVVSVTPRVGGRSVISQMSAPDNMPVSPSDRSTIIQVFGDAGIQDESVYVNDWPSELDRRLNRLGNEQVELPGELYAKINDLMSFHAR